mmetsp:Transcript_87967/g.170444  ORF Transcript_87967/g.170444 Transcript_87967/m.170444 type:complete len:258 (+) Transcript_87967:51-824(+)
MSNGVAMNDNPFNATDTGGIGQTPEQPTPASQQKQEQPAPGPTIDWQPAAAGFVSDQAWKEYGGVTQIEKEVEIPTKLLWAIRIFHVLTAFFVGLASVLAFMTGDNSFQSFIVCVYLWFFGCVLCMFETPLKLVNQIVDGNCGFMGHAAGRFFFLVLVGFLAVAFKTWGIVGGSFAFAAAALNVYAAVVYQTCCAECLGVHGAAVEWRESSQGNGNSNSNPMLNDPPAYRSENWAAGPANPPPAPQPAGAYPGGDDV